MNPYEMRWQVWCSANDFLQRKYEHQKEAYEKGMVADKPEFPTIEDTTAYAQQINQFISDKEEVK